MSDPIIENSKWIVKIKNVSGATIHIKDLGIKLLDNQERIISNTFTYDEIVISADLKSAINSEAIIVSNHEGYFDNVPDMIEYVFLENWYHVEETYAKKTDILAGGHPALTRRNDPNQHEIYAISNLTETLNALSGEFASVEYTINKGTSGGYASLDVNGKVPLVQLPATAITSTFVVGTSGEQIALDAQEGDVAIRTDISTSFIHNGGTAGDMTDWSELLNPPAPVLSVQGEIGSVWLDANEITSTGGNVQSDVDALSGAIDLLEINKADLSYVDTQDSALSGAIDVLTADLFANWNSHNTLSASASGDVLLGKPLVMNPNGTVSEAGFSDAIFGTKTLVGNTNSTYNMAATYDPVNEKIVATYLWGGGSYRPRYVVGSLTGGTLSFGPPADIDTTNSNDMAVAYDPVSGKIVVVYNGSGGWARVGTISGTTISWGAAVSIGSTTAGSSFVFDPVNNTLHLVYKDVQSYIRTITVSGTTIIAGTPTVFLPGGQAPKWATFDTTNNKTVVLINDPLNGYYTSVVVIDYDGANYTVGSPVQLGTTDQTGQGSIVYDSNTNKIIVFISNYTSQIKAAVGTVSGTSISFGAFTEIYAYSASSRFHGMFHPVSNSSLFFHRNSTSTTMTEIVVGAGDIPVLKDSTDYPVQIQGSPIVWDSVNQTSVVVYQDMNASAYGYSNTYQPGESNVSDNNFLGFSQNIAADGNLVKVGIEGFRDSNQTGLVAGTNYYVQQDGSLSSTRSIAFAGQAVGSTDILVKGYDDSLQTYIDNNFAVLTANDTLEYWTESYSLTTGTKWIPNTGSAVVIGDNTNEVDGTFSSILGGENNIIHSGTYHTILGGGYTDVGFGNEISGGDYHVIIGGAYNKINNGFSSGIFAGGGNTITNSSYAKIIGGGATITSSDSSIALGESATITNGSNNIAGGNNPIITNSSYSTIGGGHNNTIQSDNATIGGGQGNTITATATVGTIAGGSSNQVTYYGGFVGGGGSNEANGGYSVIGGGYGNYIWQCPAYDDGYNTVCGGYDNRIESSSEIAFIGGGRYNRAQGILATVCGGGHQTNNTQGNRATNIYSSILGGSNQLASGQYSSIGGGLSNTASNTASVIAGGSTNTNSSYAGAICGGRDNTASNNYSFIGAGYYNIASGNASVVCGGGAGSGLGNEANASYSSIVGGYDNYIIAGADYTFIGGGWTNRINNAAADNSTIAGGYNNTINGASSFIGGGYQNSVTATNTGGHVIAGGLNNTINSGSGGSSFIGSGYQNSITSGRGFIGTGDYNNISGPYSSIAGGMYNSITGQTSFIGGGGWAVLADGNTVAGNASSIVGGRSNIIQTGSDYSFLGGGQGNSITGDWDVLGGGQNNSITHSTSLGHSTIGGGYSNAISVQRATIAGGYDCTINTSGVYGFIGGGYQNIVNGNSATVCGGSGNDAINTNATVCGGQNNTASNTADTVCGGNGNTSSGGYGFVGGGNSNNATGTYSVIGGGDIQTASGQRSAIAGGSTNTSSGPLGFIGGGYGNIALGENSVVGGGYTNEANGFNSTVGGGGYGIGFDKNIANADYSCIPGGSAARADVKGQFAFSSGKNNTIGDSQSSRYVLRSHSLDATPIVMKTTYSTDTTSALNQIAVKDGQAISFIGTVTAKQDSSTNLASWKVEGVAVREGTTTTLVANTKTVISNVPGWNLTIQADDTNDCIQFVFTGTAATLIRAVATIDTSEVIF